MAAFKTVSGIVSIITSVIDLVKAIRRWFQKDPEEEKRKDEEKQKEAEKKAGESDNTDGLFGGGSQ